MDEMAKTRDDEYTRYIVLLAVARPELFGQDLFRAHVAHLKGLEDEGRLELAGPFSDHSGGMLVLRNVSADEALAIAASDPLVTSGAETCEIRRLDVSCRANNHMGLG